MTITDTKIEKLARSVMDSMSDVRAGRATYLAALCQAVQEELGERGKDKDIALQLSAIRTVHQRFYAIVLEAAEEFVPKGTKNRSVELHRRCTFARTSVSALRMHVKAGGDVMTLKPQDVNKRLLRAKAPIVVDPGKVLKRAVRESGKLVQTFALLAESDKGAAIEQMQSVLSELTSQLVGLGGGRATRDPTVASAESRPLKVGRLHFLPISSEPANEARVN